MLHKILWFLTLLAGSLILAGCSSKPSAPQTSSSGSPQPPAWSQNGWSNAERAEYYHLAEGSELMPYALLANVVSVKTGKPFLENMERFGFLPDAASSTTPHGLPIGLTIAGPRFSEGKILALGAAYQRVTHWHARNPSFMAS